MTRKSKREIERAVDDLAGRDGPDDDTGGPAIVWETDDGYVDGDGEPVPTTDDGDPVGPSFGPVIIFKRSLVMRREQAEREGYEILGPAEDAPADDAVRVVRED
jgi:hypothetical protein